MDYKYTKNEQNAIRFAMDIISHIVLAGLKYGKGVRNTELIKKFNMSKQAFHWHTSQQHFQELLDIYKIGVSRGKYNEKIYTLNADKLPKR